MKKPKRGTSRKASRARSHPTKAIPKRFRFELTWEDEPQTTKSPQETPLHKVATRVVMIKLAGVILQDEATLLQKCFEGLERISVHKVILNLAQVSIISGRGIAVLLRLRNQSQKQKRKLEIPGFHPTVRQTLEELGLSQAFGLKAAQ